MKKVTVSAKRWAMHCRQRGSSYAVDLQPAIIATLPDGALVLDADHPAWFGALAAYRQGRRAQPAHLLCDNCGDKTNAAAVKASPEAQEKMLRGG